MVILSSVTLCECAEDDDGETCLEDLPRERLGGWTTLITDVYDLIEGVRTSRELRPQVPAICLKFTYTSRGLRAQFV